jgi:hypothetical protein
MADINFAEDKEIFELIQRVLNKRNLSIGPGDWQVHGPHHPDMSFKVFVGLAIDINDELHKIVIYPKGKGWTLYKILGQRRNWQDPKKRTHWPILKNCKQIKEAMAK